MSGPDSDFEQGVRLVRDSYLKKVSEKDTEIVHLRGECARKDAEIRDLQTRISQLEVQVARTDKRMAEMSRIITKLNSFKQSVIESFAGDEEYSHLKTNTSVGGTATGAPNNVNETMSTNLPYQNLSRGAGHQTYGYDHSMASGGSTGVGGPHSQSNTRGTSPQHPRSLSRQPSNARGQSHLTNDTFDPQAAGTTLDASAMSPKQLNEPSSAGKNKGGTIDGRDFFKSARARLSYDEFTTLLWNVKAYNARDQSRSRTLENLKELFGEKYKDLYDQFERMLLGALNQV